MTNYITTTGLDINNNEIPITLAITNKNICFVNILTITILDDDFTGKQWIEHPFITYANDNITPLINMNIRKFQSSKGSNCEIFSFIIINNRKNNELINKLMNMKSCTCDILSKTKQENYLDSNRKKYMHFVNYHKMQIKQISLSQLPDFDDIMSKINNCITFNRDDVQKIFLELNLI